MPKMVEQIVLDECIGGNSIHSLFVYFYWGEYVAKGQSSK